LGKVGAIKRRSSISLWRQRPLAKEYWIEAFSLAKPGLCNVEIISLFLFLGETFVYLLIFAGSRLNRGGSTRTLMKMTRRKEKSLFLIYF